MKNLVFSFALFLAFIGSGSAQKLPDEFDIQFGVQNSYDMESVEVKLVSKKDPIMASLISKQIIKQVITDIENNNTDNLFILDAFKYQAFSQELLNTKLTHEEEYWSVDDFGEESINIDTIRNTLQELFVVLNFSVGYDLNKNSNSAKLVSVDFMLALEHIEGEVNQLILRKVYGVQPNFEMTFENSLYSNMYFDKSFSIQEYNYLISVPLIDIEGWAINQKQINYLPLSRALFEQNSIPEQVLDVENNVLDYQSTLINSYTVEIYDEYGESEPMDVQDTSSLDQLMVLYNIKCELDEVIKVKSIKVQGYGVLKDSMEDFGFFQFYYFQ